MQRGDVRPKNANVATDKAGNVISHGRFSAITPHALVVVVAALDPREYQKRKGYQNPEYPLHDISQLNARKGELAMYVRDSSAPTRNNPNNVDRYVSTSCSGLSSLIHSIAYAGQIANSAAFEDGKHDDLSVVVSGPITVTVTGDRYIPPGSLVQIQWPKMLMQDGKKLPASPCDVGGKFVLEVCPFSYLDVPHQFFTVNREVREILIKKGLLDVTKMPHAIKFDDTKRALEAVATLHENHTPFMGLLAEKRSPMKRYIQWLIYSYGGTDDNLEWRLSLNNEPIDTMRDRSTPHLSRQSRIARPRIQRSAYSQKSTLADSDIDAYARNFPFIAFAEQTNLYRGLIIGKALTAGIRGMDLDILTGFFNDC